MTRRVRIAAWLLAGVAAVALLLTWRTGLVGAPRIAGFYSPIFSPDGASVFVIERQGRAMVTGLGYEMFTPPATVRYFRDRYALLQVRVSDGAVTTVERFPPSPLEGTSVTSYRNALFGNPAVHLRWRDAQHLEYEIAVTIHAVPSSRTFVIRTLWDERGQKYASTSQWQEGPPRMSGGLEPQQFHGDLEVLAVPGSEAVPCAVVILRQGDAAGRTLLATTGCAGRSYSTSALAALSRRTEIEHEEKVRTTYADLVARGLRAGLSDGQARLAAGREMERLGLYPRTPKLIAAAAACEGAEQMFDISDEEFRVGLFPDIERAIAEPGKAIDRDGTYITHRDYTTSKRLNDFLASGARRFFVRARGRCWEMTIDK